MPTLSDDTIRYLQTSPFFAILEGKDGAAQDAFYAQFDALPKPIREFLLSPTTADGVSAIISGAQLPGSYHAAISKIVALAAMGEIPVASIEELLMKLNLPPEQSAMVAQKIQVILEPIVAERARRSVPAMPELPPLTQRVPPVTPSLDSSKTPARNIIDFRK